MNHHPSPHSSPFRIVCPHHGVQDVGSDAIVSRHRTSGGQIAYVRCPCGHLMVHEFGRAWAALAA